MSEHEPAAHAESGAGRETGEHGADNTADVKRRFREALDRKRARGRAGDSHLDAGSSGKPAPAPAGHKRSFRRKTG